MKIEDLRKRAEREEIDYPFLLSNLKNYSRPREKISAWIKSGELIRIKKGLYVFGKNSARRPYSIEVLSNLIYGPSAISLSYALSYYGLIPERVSMVTNITNKRNKSFKTPMGQFIYYYLHPSKYSVGIKLQSISKDIHFLMASPEKAICDVLYSSDKKLIFNNLEELEKYLIHDLRIDKASLVRLNSKKITEIGAVYQNKKVDLFKELMKGWRKKHE